MCMSLERLLPEHTTDVRKADRPKRARCPFGRGAEVEVINQLSPITAVALFFASLLHAGYHRRLSLGLFYPRLMQN